MEWLASLLLAAASCVALVGCEGSAGPFCEGLNSCYNNFTLEIYKGGSRSLHLPLNTDCQKLVKKCDPETKTWKEEILAVPGESNPLANKTILISLIDEVFTVRNAEKTEGGLYKIEDYLNNHCLAIVNITVMDPPLSTSVTPSNVTETAKVFPPGTDYGTFALIAILIIFGSVGVIIVGIKLIKSVFRPMKDTCEVDPEKLMNGSAPHQQETTTV